MNSKNDTIYIFQKFNPIFIEYLIGKYENFMHVKNY